MEELTARYKQHSTQLQQLVNNLLTYSHGLSDEFITTHYIWGCAGFVFKSGQSQILLDLGTQIWPEPDPDLGRTCSEVTEQYA